MFLFLFTFFLFRRVFGVSSFFGVCVCLFIDALDFLIACFGCLHVLIVIISYSASEE